jgi:hypothetical protein
LSREKLTGVKIENPKKASGGRKKLGNHVWIAQKGLISRQKNANWDTQA